LISEEIFEKVQEKDIKIEVFGFGYVGFPLAVRLSSEGFKVDMRSNEDLK